MTNLTPFKPFARQPQTRPQARVSLFDDLFETFMNDDFFKAPSSSSDLILRPNLDIAESDKEYAVSIEIPGVEEKDIKLEVEDRTLTVSGEKNRESDEFGKNWHRVERSYGSFQRVLSLPDDVNENKINALFKNGVLTVSLPRSQDSKNKKKTINIKAA